MPFLFYFFFSDFSAKGPRSLGPGCLFGADFQLGLHHLTDTPDGDSTGAEDERRTSSGLHGRARDPRVRSVPLYCACLLLFIIIIIITQPQSHRKRRPRRSCCPPACSPARLPASPPPPSPPRSLRRQRRCDPLFFFCPISLTVFFPILVFTGLVPLRWKKVFQGE
ncbi:hypothetical protein FA10DRAFT_9134 [Acaromyces ingoldii]|uniref:Uncharacterized protein n=1 Tax=Acaromyces ingoldii TaxID=215250 RepID=A0A316YUV9_9BASI|nr:hypothetical protein FA10DRAFT_9134 [Acaromyces ingoldii]PWN92892.1 hypothetical protein FA10DRAFT_9134 [Acaromyces ingoldii]